MVFWRRCSMFIAQKWIVRQYTGKWSGFDSLTGLNLLQQQWFTAFDSNFIHYYTRNNQHMSIQRIDSRIFNNHSISFDEIVGRCSVHSVLYLILYIILVSYEWFIINDRICVRYSDGFTFGTMTFSGWELSCYDCYVVEWVWIYVEFHWFSNIFEIKG